MYTQRFSAFLATNPFLAISTTTVRFLMSWHVFGRARLWFFDAASILESSSQRFLSGSAQQTRCFMHLLWLLVGLVSQSGSPGGCPVVVTVVLAYYGWIEWVPRFALQADCGRMKIACIGENVSKKHGLTNRDVCVACALQVDWLLWRILLWSPRTLTLLCARIWLAKKLLLVTGQALCSRRVPQLLWTVLLHIFLLCSACSLVTTGGCLSVLVVGRPTHGALLLLGLVAPMPREVWPQVDTADLYGCGGQNPFVLYAWASRCSYMFLLCRHCFGAKKDKKGLPTPNLSLTWFAFTPLQVTSWDINWWEDFGLKTLFGWFAGFWPEARIRAMESFEIATRRPGCNVPMRHNPKSTKVVSPTRSRPPKHARKPSPFVGPFDCAASRLSMDKLAYKMGRPKASLVVPDEASNFSLAYLAWVRKLFVLHGTFGPYDIYDPRLAGLLVRWCGSKGSERVGCGPAAIWKSLSLLKGRRARTMATRNGSREIVARNLPKTFGVTFKVAREACLRVVKPALVHAVRFDQWNHDEKTWLLSRLRLAAGPSEKHSRLCNAPAVSKRTGRRRNSWACQALAWVWQSQQPRSCWKDLGCSFASFCSEWPACNFRLCPFDVVLVFVSTVGVRAKLMKLFPWRMRVCKPTPATCVSNGSSHKLTALTRPTLLTCQDDRARLWSLTTSIENSCGGFRLLVTNGYQWLLLKFACLAPAWELTTLIPEEAETWCQRVFHTLIPDHLKQFLGVHRMSHILPYDYGTLKATCFSA